MNKEKILSIGALVLLIVAVSLYGVFGTKKADKVAQNSAVSSVATVNGVPITEAAFDAQLALATSTLKSQGTDVISPDKLAQIKTQVLNDLINTEIVNQEISKAGIKATPEQVESQYQVVIQQIGGADKLAAQLATANMSDATLRLNIAKQIAIQAYLLQNIATSSITVSDAEIKKFYDDNTKGQKDVPPLKQLSAQIKQQIINTKQQTLVNDFVASLRAKAKVETTLK